VEDPAVWFLAMREIRIVIRTSNRATELVVRARFLLSLLEPELEMN